MRLNGITIMSCEMFADQWRKPDFDMKEIWKNIANGTLESFEQQVEKQNSGLNAGKMSQVKRELALEIRHCIWCLQGEDTAQEFLCDGRLDTAAMNAKLESFSESSLGRDQLDFFSRNEDGLTLLYGTCEDAWNQRQVYTLYLFLLLQLQILPKDPIREKDIAFLRDRMLQQSSAKVVHREACRICLTEDLILRCIGREVQCYDLKKRSGWTTYYRSDEPVAGIAFTEALGLLAFTRSGKLCKDTAVRIGSTTAGESIVMASAYGRQYLLLTKQGNVISNLPLAGDPAWKEISWICAGLNSAAGISGKKSNAVVFGLDWNEDHTDVKTIVTHSSRGSQRFAVLKNDGTMISDQGESVEDVAAVCMGTYGYIYIKDQTVFLRPFDGGPDRIAAKLPGGMDIAELHSVGNIFVCGTAEKPFLGILSGEV